MSIITTATASGSVTEISDAGGNLVERYEYDVYGAPTIFDSSNTELSALEVEPLKLFTPAGFCEMAFFSLDSISCLC